MRTIYKLTVFYKVHLLGSPLHTTTSRQWSKNDPVIFLGSVLLANYPKQPGQFKKQFIYKYSSSLLVIVADVCLEPERAKLVSVFFFFFLLNMSKTFNKVRASVHYYSVVCFSVAFRSTDCTDYLI